MVMEVSGLFFLWRERSDFYKVNTILACNIDEIPEMTPNSDAAKNSFQLINFWVSLSNFGGVSILSQPDFRSKDRFEFSPSQP